MNLRLFLALACVALTVIAEAEAAIAVALEKLDVVSNVVNNEAQQNSPKRKCQDLMTDSNGPIEMRLGMYEKCSETGGDDNADNLVDTVKDGAGEDIEDFKRVSGIKRPRPIGCVGCGAGGGASTKSISIVTFILTCLVAKL